MSERPLHGGARTGEHGYAEIAEQGCRGSHADLREDDDVRRVGQSSDVLIDDRA
jgi:hypothetical protein